MNGKLQWALCLVAFCFVFWKPGRLEPSYLLDKTSFILTYQFTLLHCTVQCEKSKMCSRYSLSMWNQAMLTTMLTIMLTIQNLCLYNKIQNPLFHFPNLFTLDLRSPRPDLWKCGAWTTPVPPDQYSSDRFISPGRSQWDSNESDSESDTVSLICSLQRSPQCACCRAGRLGGLQQQRGKGEIKMDSR